MEPLSALSAATPILQLIDHTQKFLKLFNAIVYGKSSAGVNTLRAIAIDLILFTQAMSTEERPMLSADEGLHTIKFACARLAVEVSEATKRLVQVEIASRDAEKFLNTALEHMRMQWPREKVETSLAELTSRQQELAQCILASFNSSGVRHDSVETKGIENVERPRGDVVDVVSITRNNMVATPGAKAASSRPSAPLSGAKREGHEEVVAALITLRDGTRETLAWPKASSSHGNNDSQLHFSASRYFRPPELPRVALGPEPANATFGSYDPVVKGVLDLLFFRQITERFDGITEAHKRTFNWIFDDPIISEKPWDNFRSWLEAGVGCYWINGKAGSGKSTLMKYIRGHYQTSESLARWGGVRVIEPAYFFYSLGTTLQKSYEGLLRSLLYDILSRNVHHITTCFPDVCRAILKGEQIDETELSFTELKKAFTILLRLASDDLKICMFIDGVDEYKGDLTQLLELFALVEMSQSAKIVISSRPTAACTRVFSRHKSLRLQDLTMGDIRLYVDDYLGNHPNLRDIWDEEPAASLYLVTEIAERASGVFLWVMLVVRSLLQGLDNYDRISDLRKRLDELPKNLKELYQHMLDQMEPLYRQEGSKYLQIVLRSQDIQDENPMDLYQLWHAEDNPMSVLDGTSVLLVPRISAGVKAAEARLRSRCCGLIEVQEFRDEDKYKLPRQVVTFLHKTVSEFLREEGIWPQLLQQTDGLDFDVNFSLLCSCVREVQMETSHLYSDSHHLMIFHKIRYAINYANSIDLAKQSSVIPVLYKLDRILSNTDQNRIRQSAEQWTLEKNSPFTMLSVAMQSPWFVSYTAYAGSPFYLTSRLRNSPSGLTVAEKTSVLLQLTLSVLYSGNADFEIPSAKILQLLLQYPGANPNELVALGHEEGLHAKNVALFLHTMDACYQQSSYSTWSLVLLYLDRLSQGVKRPKFSPEYPQVADLMEARASFVDFLQPSRRENIFKLVTCLLQNGADVNKVCHIPKASGGSIARSALSIMTEFSTRLQDFFEGPYSEENGSTSFQLSDIEGTLSGLIAQMRRKGAVHENAETVSTIATNVSTAPSPSPEPRQHIVDGDLAESHDEAESTSSHVPAPPYALSLVMSTRHRYSGSLDLPLARTETETVPPKRLSIRNIFRNPLKRPSASLT